MSADPVPEAAGATTTTTTAGVGGAAGVAPGRTPDEVRRARAVPGRARVVQLRAQAASR